jgi:FkbM family methyltransferase
VLALPELSTMASHIGSDHHLPKRLGETTEYSVTTVSLLDLLAEHGAPRVIDYLSVDTEGTEYEILQAFDFDAYDVRVLTVEHNHTEKRELLHALLSQHGYKRRFEELSLWDDWYVRT